ncbi:MAG: hypothetical protein RLZZ182_1584 [Pseudomonadota bacterium]
MWRGLKSRQDVLKAAALLQDALKAARANGSWTLDGLEPLSAGRGGDSLASDVKQLERLAHLDAQLAEFRTLEGSTDGLWKGLEADVPALEAAIAFTGALPDLRTAGAMPEKFDLVAQGACGSRLAKDHATLKEREGVETKLAGLDDLKTVCSAVWKKLETDQEEVARAVAFQRSIAAAVANLAAGPEDVAQVCRALEQLVTEGNALLDVAGPVAEAGNAYLEALGRLQPSIDLLASRGSFTVEGVSGYSDADVAQLKSRVEAIMASEHKLNA